MHLLTLILISGAFYLFSCGEKTDTKTASSVDKMQNPDTMTGMQENEVIYYTCPMEEHKHIHSDKAGKCPECNMDLVAAVNASEENTEYYGCPMESHSHIRHEKSGKCEECGMELKPMRLKIEI